MSTEPADMDVTTSPAAAIGSEDSMRRSPIVADTDSPGDDGDPAIRRRPSGAQAVERALAVLGCFVREQEASGLGVTEVTSMLGLSLGTTHRLVRVLLDFGYLEQDSATSRYRLGRAALLLGHAAERELGFDRARSVIEALSATTGESLNLGIRAETTAR